jgi:hypothetical protein
LRTRGYVAAPTFPAGRRTRPRERP